MYSKLFFRLTALGTMLLPQIVFAQLNSGKIRLMEPIGKCGELTGKPGLDTFFTYFNLLWPWMIGTSAGIAVLMAIAGGIQIIMSGGDPGKRGEGVQRLMNALLGLLMLIFAGLLLNTLNPSFFVKGPVGSGGC